MFRVVAMTVLALSAASGSDVTAGKEDTGDPQAQISASQRQAEQRAREALAQHLKIAADDITVTRAAPRTWSDSSMGCGKPGTVALTVITEGYAVSLQAQGSEHQVHVSGASAVVCDKGASLRRDLRRPASVRGLDVMLERSRQDLAQRLGVDAAEIRLTGMQPHRWTDSALDCPREGEAVQPGPIDGYRLSLKYASRVYTYHTDRKDVRPCPPIESQ